MARPLRTVTYQSSGFRSSIAAAATVCWASTSKGVHGMVSVSMSPERMHSMLAAVPMICSRVIRVEQCMRDSPTLWSARPTRCNPEDTDNGGAIWMTRSTEPMSMPSSRLDVATTQRNWPRLSCSSICLRRSLETEP